MSYYNKKQYNKSNLKNKFISFSKQYRLVKKSTYINPYQNIFLLKGVKRKIFKHLCSDFLLNSKRIFSGYNSLTKFFLNRNKYFSKDILRNVNNNNKIVWEDFITAFPKYALMLHLPKVRIDALSTILQKKYFNKNVTLSLKRLLFKVRKSFFKYPNLYYSYFSILNNIMLNGKRVFSNRYYRSSIHGFLAATFYDNTLIFPSKQYSIKKVMRRFAVRRFDASQINSTLRYSHSNFKFRSKFRSLIKPTNFVDYHNSIHYKEWFKLENSDLKNVKLSDKSRVIKKLLETKYRRKIRFSNMYIKTKPVVLSNKKILNSSFYYGRNFFGALNYMTRKFFIKAAFFNRRTFRKKNWKFTKLNSKRHSPRTFLRRSLSFGFFKRQDSFRLLHIFRTILLKYSYSYKSFNLLKFFKNLKNSLIIDNSANTFVERFLWHMERSANMLIFRSKYAPTIKTSNHLIRYGFFMLNNQLITNPYIQVSLFDVIRVAKTKYFLKLFLRDFVLLFGFRRKKHIKPFYLEINRRILALSVFRKPKLNDFVLNKKTISPRPEINWYLSLPTIAALF